jgi:hypothetical protein
VCLLALALLAVAAPAQATLPLPAPVPSPVPAPPVVEGPAPYVGQVSCDPTAKPGTTALATLVHAHYGVGRNGGISRDCSVGGTSEHKEGRAWDWMLNASDPVHAATADAFLGWLTATGPDGQPGYNARRLGVMYVIWNAKTWSPSRADRGWTPYTGASPHTDHIHVSLAWNGAMRRTSFWTGQVAPHDYGPCRPGPDAPAPAYSGPRSTPCPSFATAPVQTSSPACPGGAPSAGYADVAPGAVARYAVDCAAAWGLVQGTSPGAFSPARTVTRGQVAAMLARQFALAGKLPKGAPNAFSDDDGTTHEAAIDAMAALGVVQGTGPGRFAPERGLTRDQMAAVLVRAQEALTGKRLAEGTTPFVDVAGNVHTAAIAKAYVAKLASGTTASTYAPAGAVTRAQMAMFLIRSLDRLVQAGIVEPR